MTKPLTILAGHVLDKLTELPAESVHCIVTSPPYFGLRDYGIKPVKWPAIQYRPMGDAFPVGAAEETAVLGLESNLTAYVGHLVLIFREAWRVLRSDGVLWLNLGDSYCGSGKGGNPGLNGDELQRRNRGSQTVRGRAASPHTGLKAACDKWSPRKNPRANNCYQDGEVPVMKTPPLAGLKSKDLMGVPWRVAFALQADGWYLRMDNIWSKPNPMPEGVIDRCTKSHEYLFLLSKSKTYYYDAEAVKERASLNTHPRVPGNVNPPKGQKAYEEGDHRQRTKAGLLKHARKSAANAFKVKQNESFEEATSPNVVASRNKRSVWTVSSQPYNAHFATFPPKLITPCILAGTSAKGCCSACGAPYRRVLEDGEANLEQQKACGGDRNGEYHGTAVKDFAAVGVQNASDVKARILAGMVEKKTVGWQPTCDCGAGIVPCTVMDIFFGSGTVGAVSLDHGRHCIGIEMNDKYIDMAKERCDVTPGLKGLA